MKANQGGFDDLEPSADLWNRIEKHLPAEGSIPQKREARTFSLSFVLKVAASMPSTTCANTVKPVAVPVSLSW